MKKIFIGSFLSVFLIFLIFPAYAQQPPVCDWRGYVTVDGNLTNSSHVLASYTNGSNAANGIIFSGGYYIIPVPGVNGDNISFYVSGVLVNESNQSTNITWSCGGVGYNTLNLTMNKTADGTSCTYALGCSGNYCVHNICRSNSTYCGDSYCDTGESCSSDNSACSTNYECTNGCVLTSPGTGSGPDNQTTPPPNVSADVTEIVVINNISAGSSETATFFTADELGIESITINAINAVQNVQIEVTKHETRPSSISAPSGVGSVYSYITITISGVSAADLESAVVKFKVGQTWISGNNIDKSTVVLKRFTTQWDDLTTTLVSEDLSFVFYEAETPGFSAFAVTGNTVVAAPPPEPPPLDNGTGPGPGPSEPVPDYTGVIIAVIAIILIMLILLLSLGKSSKRGFSVSKGNKYSFSRNN